MCVRPQSSSLLMALLREGKKKPSVDIWDTAFGSIPSILRLSSCGPLIGWAFVFIDTPGYWPHWSCQMALPTRWSSNSMCSNVQIRSFDKHQLSLLVYLCDTSSPNTIITGFSFFFILFNKYPLPTLSIGISHLLFRKFSTLHYSNQNCLFHQCFTSSDSFTSAPSRPNVYCFVLFGASPLVTLYLTNFYPTTADSFWYQCNVLFISPTLIIEYNGYNTTALCVC